MPQNNVRSILCSFRYHSLLISLMLCSGVAVSAMPTERSIALQVGRYSTVIPAPRQGQSNLLAAIVNVDFPETITTVGEAIEQVLQDSGYRLVEAEQMPIDSGLMLTLPLPRVHRHLQSLPLWQVLRTLVGPQFVLVNDPVHRLIAFEPCGPAVKGESL